MTSFGGSEGDGEVVVQESQCDSQAGGVAAVGEPSRSELPWLAAYTRPRHEEKVKQFCEERGIETFLPCRQTVRCWTDRRKLVSQPLFPSYIFMKLDEHQRRRAVQAPGFLRFVRSQAGPAEVDPGELRNLRVALANGLACDPLPGVKPGDPVEIIAGPLRGCRGHLERKDSGAIVLQISAINGAVRVRLPDGAAVRVLPTRPCSPPAPGPADWARYCG